MNETPRQYALFFGHAFYPRGGWKDLVHWSEDLGTLKDKLQDLRHANDYKYIWWQIVSLTDWTIVEEGRD